MAGLYSGGLAFLYVAGHPLSINEWRIMQPVNLSLPKPARFCRMASHCQFYNYKSPGGTFLSFKILKNNCCGLDVHKTWIYACIGITDSNKRTEYKQARFSSFTRCFLKPEVICLSSPQLKTPFHGQDAVPVTTKATARLSPLGFPVLVPVLNQFWCKLQML